MSTFMDLCLCVATFVNVYYIWRERGACHETDRLNVELSKSLREIDLIKGELLAEQFRLKQIAHRMTVEAVGETVVPTMIDLKGKPWIN
jgi:hypothetical protein